MVNRIDFTLMALLPLLMTLLYGGVHQPVIGLFFVGAATLLVLWAVECWVTGEIKISRSYLQLPIILIAAYALIQTLPFGSVQDPGLNDIPRTISADPFATRLAALQFLALGAFFAFAIVHLNTAKRLRRVAGIITVFGFAYALFAVLQSLISPEAIYGLYRPDGAVPFGTFVNRNDFAALVVLLASLPLGILFSGVVPKDKRLLYIIAVATMGTSILLSRSRGGSVAFICEIILLIIFTRRASGRKSLLLSLGLSVLLIAAVIGGAVFVGGETSLARFGERDVAFETSSVEGTTRDHIWGTTIRMIGDNMPFGVGLGAYPAVYPQYDTSSGSQRVEQAHNDYLQTVSDSGVVGALLGVWFLYLLMRQGRESLRVTNEFRRSVACGALAGIVAILLHSLFDFVLHITAVALMFLLLTAVLVACSRSGGWEASETQSSRRRGVKPQRDASAPRAT